MSKPRPRPLPLLLALLLGLPALMACGGAKPVAQLVVDTREFQLPHGRHVTLELRWQPRAPLPEGARPVVFVHLVDADKNVVRTFDHELRGRWQVGQEIVDRVSLYHSSLGPALAPGDYRLTGGLYDGDTERFPITFGDQASEKREYTLARVRVPDTAGGPAFRFSPEWLPVEPGGDRQTVARRWLSGDGAIEAHGLPRPANVWLLLRLPKVEPPLRLVLEPGATQPQARVAQDCGGFAATVAGEGFHELTVPVADGRCRIALDTNFAVLEMGTGRKLSLGIEQLGWDRGAAR